MTFADRYVSDPAPGRELPDGTTIWFSIDNMKKDIKALRKIESGKLSWKDRRQARKIIKLAKKRANVEKGTVPNFTLE